MATQLQLRRGNTAQTAVFTGVIAEVTVDTDQKTVVVHDGATVGGNYIITKPQFEANVTALNNFAQSAYDTANTKFNSAGGSITGDVTISGSLSVTGNTIYANVEQLIVEDNIITLNSNVTGEPTLDSGIEINRGLQPNTYLLWNESDHAWEFTNNGTSYFKIADTDRVNSVYSLANTNSDNIAVIQGVDTTQNTRLNSIETVNQDQNTSISIIQGTDNTQNVRLNSIETINNEQNTSINIINGVDATQNIRLNSIETVNQNQNTTITEVNQFAAAAYAQANTGATNINFIQGVDDTQNTRLNSIETVNQNQNTSITEVNQYSASAYALANTNASNISITNGVDATQNTRLNAIETINSNQNNTITQVNQFTQSSYDAANGANYLAQAAFDSSNTKFASAGGTITGSVLITGNNNLTVTGDLTVFGNTTSIGTQTLDVVDPMIILGVGNYTTDVVDIGFAAHYNNGTNAHTGLIRDAGTRQWYLFQGYTPELSGNNNIDINDASFDTANLVAKKVRANVIADFVTTDIITVSGRELGAYTQMAYDTANGAAGSAASAYNQANTNAANIAYILNTDSWQNTQISAVNLYAAGAYNLANTNAADIITINSINAVQNTRLNSIETINTNQNTSISIIQGVDNTQNTRLDSIEAINSNQNTSITAVNNFAQAAYNQANTAFSTGGGTITGNVVFSGTITLQNGTTISDANTYYATNSANQVLDIFSSTQYRSAKYLIQATSGPDVQIIEFLVFHNDYQTFNSIYTNVKTGIQDMITFATALDTGTQKVTVYVSPTGYGTNIVASRTAVPAGIVFGGIWGDLMLQSGSNDLNTETGSQDLNF